MMLSHWIGLIPNSLSTIVTFVMLGWKLKRLLVIKPFTVDVLLECDSDGRLRVKINAKRDDFKFWNLLFPFLQHSQITNVSPYPKSQH